MQTRTMRKLVRESELSRRRTQFEAVNPDYVQLVEAGWQAREAGNFVVAAECVDLAMKELEAKTNG